ncbi:hypothetical protein Poli38472_007126 [Pythium oligandrum]|uniref:Uncharacterized protein n=1 Tax=Pythium oligandrum TaxID=41045 RepID=A0A8K1FE27_PYTOL|nr:hypothetical protein Poli38472_007126 [Pythium oligandrum]|eukprot:TMW58981.1 hypothetical protein Poli38472_007126 [Pythium oligandrum]
MDIDEPTLDAVLAFIDGYESDHTAREASLDETSASASDGTDSSESQPERKPQKRPNKGLKHDLDYLRRQVEGLQGTLEALTTTLVRTHGKGEFERRMQLLGKRRELSSSWKRIAERQKERRHAAEEENSRLRRRLLSQRRALIGFHRVMQQELAEAELSTPERRSSGLPAWTATASGNSPRDIMTILGELLTDVKLAYDGTGSWLLTAQSLRSSGKDTTVRLVPLSPNELVIERLDVRILPFEFDSVAKTSWKVGINQFCFHYDEVREVTEVEGRETVFSSQSVHSVVEAEHASNIHVKRHATAQRFVGEERGIIVHVGRSQSVQMDGHQLAGLTLAEQHWSVFQPSEAGGCRMTSSSRFLLQVDHDRFIPKDTMMLLYTYLTTKAQKDLDAISSLIEDTRLLAS